MTDNKRKIKPPPRLNAAQRTYSDAEVERGLFALALCSGNSRRAEALLTEDGDGIPASTLAKWKQHRHADRYIRIQQQVYPQIAERMAEEMEDLFTTELELERQLVERVKAELPNLKPGELSTALRNVGVTKALNVDKSAPIRGRPGQIVQHDFDGAMEGLRRLGLLIDGEADEILEIPRPPLNRRRNHDWPHNLTLNRWTRDACRARARGGRSIAGHFPQSVLPFSGGVIKPLITTEANLVRFRGLGRLQAWVRTRSRRWRRAAP